MIYKKNFWVGLGCVFLMIFAVALLDSWEKVNNGTMRVEESPFTLFGFTALVLMFPLAACSILPIMHVLFVMINRKNKREAAIAFGLPESEIGDNAESPMEMLRRTGIEK